MLPGRLVDEGGHLLFSRLDLLEQPELHASAVQVVAWKFDFEIRVPAQIIGKEPDAELEGDHLYRRGKQFDLPRRRKSARLSQIAFRYRLEKLEVEPDRVQIGVLARGIGRRPDTVSEIEVNDARLRRIEIEHAERFMGARMDHDVVHLGIVVHDSKRKRSGLQKVGQQGREKSSPGHKIFLSRKLRG